MVRKRIVFLDGRILPSDDIIESALAPGKLAGKGVFETILSFGSDIFFLKQHLARLRKGIRYFAFSAPMSAAQMEANIERVVRHNRCVWARVRIMVWKDRGVVHTAVTAVPQKLLSAQQYRLGFKAGIVPERCASGALRAEVKAIAYEPYMNAYRQATGKGLDEAILLNTRGELVEGSRTNIFFVKDGGLLTPSLSCGCLKGVVRQVVVKIAHQTHVPLREGRFMPQMLKKVDEAFLTNSIIGIVPLVRVNGSSIGKGRPGPVTQRVASIYQRDFVPALPKFFLP